MTKPKTTRTEQALAAMEYGENALIQWRRLEKVVAEALWWTPAPKGNASIVLDAIRDAGFVIREADDS